MASNIKELREELMSVGKQAKEQYESSKDLKSAMISIKAFNAATRAAVAQIKYKQATSTPSKIDFLEE